MAAVGRFLGFEDWRSGVGGGLVEGGEGVALGIRHYFYGGADGVAEKLSAAMKARFPNATRQLWPGQFINVKLTLQVLPNAVTVPSIAVSQGPKGAYVYLVGPGNKVSAQPVTVIATEGATSVVQSGLKAGQLVVTDGQMTLKPGLVVSFGSQPHAGSQPPATKPAA